MFDVRDLSLITHLSYEEHLRPPQFCTLSVALFL